tara:strand:+ start:786 stop:1169 length:384 start_codon:yes stop_codon:yes gene_type:complete
MNKKDTNYIASVEKAIASKYGKETVQDFRSGWSEEKEKEYLDSLKKRNQKIDEMTADTKKTDTKNDRTCPVCKTYSFSSKDDLYMIRYKCCFQCYLEHVVGREDRWKSGYRPTDEEVQLRIRRRKNG